MFSSPHVAHFVDRPPYELTTLDAIWRRIDTAHRELLRSLSGMSALNISSSDLLSTYNATRSAVPEFCGRRLLIVVDYDGNRLGWFARLPSEIAQHTEEQQ